MSTKETGGPAFPIPGLHHDADFNGMTLRDYFIAHAPEHPQPWFKPVMPTRPNSTICVSEDGQRTYDDQWAASKAEGDNFQRVNHAEIEQWDAEYIKQKFVQWPAAWADEQIKARTK